MGPFAIADDLPTFLHPLGPSSPLAAPSRRLRQPMSQQLNQSMSRAPVDPLQAHAEMPIASPRSRKHPDTQVAS
jgi:hypothetical protein